MAEKDIVIASDSMMNNIDEKRFSRNINLKVRYFSRAMVDDFKEYLAPPFGMNLNTYYYMSQRIIENAKSTVNINGTIGDHFPVKVGVHQGAVPSPLHFIIVLEALSMEFRTGLPWELLYAHNLVLMADSIEELEILFERWRSGMEQKGLRVNSARRN